MKVAWTLAGSDPSGFAGLQADMRTFEAMNVHGMSAVSAVTSQHPDACFGVSPVSEKDFRAQIEALKEFAKPDAVKTGLLNTEGLVQIAARSLSSKDAPVIVDPVCVSSSGFRFADPATLRAYEKFLFPVASLVTPNLPESVEFSGQEDIEKAALYFLDTGSEAVLIKGGHRVSDWASDYFSNGESSFQLSLPHVSVASAPGTGCTLSAAIAAACALGHSIADAIVLAKAYLHRALSLARPCGSSLHLHHGPWPVPKEHFPRLHKGEFVDRKEFLQCEERIGFYPIVPRAAWVERLVEAGAKTVQLRIKDLRGEELLKEIKVTSEFCKTRNIQLFINDYWEEALEVGAYGVHLGQEDLPNADLDRLLRAGLRLGISTHSYSELATALYFKPSYVALGPIFPTTCKSMRFGPQGFNTLSDWCTLSDVPVVAIGGLRCEHAAEIYRAGAQGAAVVSDVLEHAAPETRAKEWLQKTKEALG
ncbi:MAG: thiamine phosphate synthase [Bdellovibrionaceae bacterium]|nr:thiamine phosphate synthase [Pseudobdellovibrionaceae bacterium]